MLTAKIISANNTLPYCHVQMIATKIRFKSNSKTLVLTCNYNGSFCIYVNLEIVYFCNVIFTRISSYNKGWHTVTSLKIVQFSRPPIRLVHTTSNILPPPWPWTSTFKRIPPPLQMITSQLKEHIIQGWLLYVIRSFLQVGFSESTP